jgi:hypothetical protein
MAPIIKKHTGAVELFSFITHPVKQVLMTRDIVFMVLLDETILERIHTLNAFSFVVKNPNEAARESIAALQSIGHTAELFEGFMPDSDQKIRAIITNAFPGALLVYRRHIFFMTLPPFVHFVTRGGSFFSLVTLIRMVGKFKK